MPPFVKKFLQVTDIVTPNLIVAAPAVARRPRWVLVERVLSNFGYMREQGKGIPRIFEAMERDGIYPPGIRMEAEAIFTVTLRNTVAYSPETLCWLAQFETMELNGNQKRILVYAKEHQNAFTSREYQKLAGVDIYQASRDIRDLIGKGLVKLHRKGGRIYALFSSGIPVAAAEIPSEYATLEPVLKKKGYIKNEDIRMVLGVSRRQAVRVAGKLVDQGMLKVSGRGRERRYLPGS